VPISEEEVDKMFKEIDIDGNGTIDYTEFVMATMNQHNMMSNEKLMQAFKMFDKDGSGTISADEIRGVLGSGTQLSEETIEDIIKEVDENGDGEI
jgi:calcium-dependent protein kinase